MPALNSLVANLACDAPGDHVFIFDARNGQQGRLWLDNVCIAEGHTDALGKVDGNNPLLIIMRKMLANEDVLAILHASSVLIDGKVIVFMGQSGSGKSTLAARLAARGGQYIGDDSVVLLRDGTVRPMPFRPTVKQGSWAVVTEDFPDFPDGEVWMKGDEPYRHILNARHAPDDFRGKPDLLVFPVFNRDAEPKTVPLTDIEKVLHLGQAGLWFEMPDFASVMDVLLALPAIALRQTPDIDATRALLAAHLA